MFKSFTKSTDEWLNKMLIIYSEKWKIRFCYYLFQINSVE